MWPMRSAHAPDFSAGPASRLEGRLAELNLVAVAAVSCHSLISSHEISGTLLPSKVS